MGETVLLVEDVDDIRFALRILIERHGYKVVEATNGEEAITNAEAFMPDLILMDLAMPTIDGFEATRRIRSNHKTSRIRIVAVTAYRDRFKEQALKAGFNDLIDKMEFMGNVGDVISRHLPLHSATHF